MRNFVNGTVRIASVALAFAALLAGCDEDCKKGKSECVSPSLIRTCVPTTNGNEWLVLQCGATEVCEDGVGRPAEADASTRADGGDAGELSEVNRVAACVGTCEVGEHACVSDSLARYCVNGGVWQLDACDVGEKCANGVCGVSSGPGSVQRCEPGAKACANEKVEKVCDPDGTAWVELPCASNEICDEDECVPDPESSCDDANACVDNKTAVRCLGQAKGFELVKCQGDQYCENGRCRGAVCAVGSVCTGGNQLRECVDGKSYRDTQCGVNEVCQQQKDVAKCVPLQCTPGTSACGDPRDPAVDTKKNFTACTSAASGSGVPEWVTGECGGNTSCNPALAATSNPCTQLCTKGAQRCGSDSVTGVNDGFQECGDDGKWGPVKACNTGNLSEKQCVIAPNPNASALPKALCAEPVCWWAFANPAQHAQGACEDDKLLECQPDGTLAEASACAQGVCRNLNAVTTADGRTPGACDSMPQCETGEEVCLTANGSATPRYRTCVAGFFSTGVETCPDDGACYNSRDAAGKRKKVCGADCAPGSGRCNDDGELERCEDNGKWGNGQQCAAGECRTLGSNDAGCVLECVPGSRSCAGSSVSAADGYHSGRSQQRLCNSDGTWADPATCDSGQACRVTSSGAGLGCVECVGPNAPGGNAEGMADTRCDPSDDKKVQDCASDNRWQSSRSCAGDKSCVEPVMQSCGMCTGAAGGMFECTDSNLRNEQICLGCQVPLSAGGTTSISVCTQSAVAATAGTATTTCSGGGLGVPSSWAGQADCCSNYQRTALQQYGAGCVGLGYGAPTSWAGLSDCCNEYRLGTSGGNFAYCE